jgi:ribose transport system substrate-binding protein
MIQQFIAQGMTPSSTPSESGASPASSRPTTPASLFAANNRIARGRRFVGANDVELAAARRDARERGGRRPRRPHLGALGTSAQPGNRAWSSWPTTPLIIEKQTANWADAEALALTQDWLSKHGEGEIDAIVGQGPEVVAGAQWAAQNNRSDVQFLAGDYPYSVKVAIEDGVVAGTVDQDPYPQGYEAVQYAYYWLTDQQDQVERPDHFLPLPIVTAENVDEYAAAWGTPE